MFNYPILCLSEWLSEKGEGFVCSLLHSEKASVNALKWACDAYTVLMSDRILIKGMISSPLQEYFVSYLNLRFV